MVGIILYGSFELAPYFKKYTKVLDDAGIAYDLIGWRREEKALYAGENVFMYEAPPAKRHDSLLHKIRPALGYRRFIRRQLRAKKYDKLIILTTQTALILADVLLTAYRGKYLFDYRDKSYEYIRPYRMLVDTIIKHSMETAISSPWFRESLTKEKQYLLVHNLQDENLKKVRRCCNKKEPGAPIAAGYVGALRSYAYHKHLIDCFANDKRFVFHTYGCGDDCERLARYAAQFPNTFVHGRYDEAEKYDIIETFDIMCYNYPSSFVNDGAIANKYYDALIMKKPMFVNPRTRLGGWIAENGLGVGVDEEETQISDTIYDWYRAMDPAAFSKTCDSCLTQYAKENTAFEEKIRSVLCAKGERGTR